VQQVRASRALTSIQQYKARRRRRSPGRTETRARAANPRMPQARHALTSPSSDVPIPNPVTRSQADYASSRHGHRGGRTALRQQYTALVMNRKAAACGRRQAGRQARVNIIITRCHPRQVYCMRIQPPQSSACDPMMMRIPMFHATARARACVQVCGAECARVRDDAVSDRKVLCASMVRERLQATRTRTHTVMPSTSSTCMCALRA
jgi:hypothetical protein